MARLSKLQRQTKVRQLIKGITKHWMAWRTVDLARKSYRPDELVACLQSVLDAHRATDAARAAWIAQVANERALEAQLAPIIRSIVRQAESRYLNQISLLADFGIVLRKTGPKKAEVKARMVERARATRIKRHTMGKRQKQKITGSR
jgi:hypothetical protein